MFLRPLHAALDLGKLRHYHQSKVTDIGLANGNELPESAHRTPNHFRRTGRAPHHDQIHGLKQYGMVGVGFVDRV